MKNTISRRGDTLAVFRFERTQHHGYVLYTLYGPADHETQAHDWALTVHADTINADRRQRCEVKWRYIRNG